MSDKKYKIDDIAICESCNRKIEYVGLYWRHAIGGKGPEYRHPARPKERKQATKKDRASLLEAALKTAEDVISWYESDAERSCYDEEDVPEDLRELEKVFEAAKEKLK